MAYWHESLIIPPEPINLNQSKLRFISESLFFIPSFYLYIFAEIFGIIFQLRKKNEMGENKMYNHWLEF